MSETPGTPAATEHACVIPDRFDRFDRFAWRDTYAQSEGLRDLAGELTALHHGAADLLTDVFLAAYKAAPRLRERARMHPSRLLNHHVLTSLMEPPDFTELRRTTAGDAYAAAMAVLAMAPALRRMLRSAPDEGEAATPSDTHETPETPETPSDTPSGTRPDAAAEGAAEQAAQALAATGSALRAAAHAASARAARAARQEAAMVRAWGVAPGETERMPFGERLRLAERLGGSRLARWADLIGRFRQMAAAERAHKVENTAGELVGVTLGDDLSRIVPSELATLGLPPLRAVFAARYAARELMVYDQQGERSTGRGAVVACVDTSHSMYEEGPGGITREAWAKACALALLDQARAAGRDFVGVLFSAADKVQVFRFPAAENAEVTRVLEFAETFLGGGTSYQRPLSVAAGVLEEEFADAARARGDIVMITDDDCGVTEEWMRGWKEARHRLGFRVFGVAVGAPRVAAADSVLDALCDNLRAVDDFTDVHAAADLFRVI
ncbi:VWA domain-containing protein [Streptomyces sp. SGAir0957]